jgi:hypothetical protein
MFHLWLLDILNPDLVRSEIVQRFHSCCCHCDPDFAEVVKLRGVDRGHSAGYLSICRKSVAHGSANAYKIIQRGALLILLQ